MRGYRCPVEPGMTRIITPSHPRNKNMQHRGYIYFMTNRTNKVLYIGVTNSLKRRIAEHSQRCGSSFTYKYNCSKLVYFEIYPTMNQAIAREKQLKHFKREWKNQLVETINPEWKDLSESIICDPVLL